MGTYLPDKIKDLTKDGWKKAREEAGFEATLFGGAAVGSKIESFKKMKAKADGDENDIKKLAAYLRAARDLTDALLQYHEKAKKKNVEFANELKALATKMEKKLDKIDQAYQKLAQLWDQVTKGGFSGSQKAVNNLFNDLHM